MTLYFIINNCEKMIFNLLNLHNHAFEQVKMMFVCIKR